MIAEKMEKVKTTQNSKIWKATGRKEWIHENFSALAQVQSKALAMYISKAQPADLGARCGLT